MLRIYAPTMAERGPIEIAAEKVRKSFGDHEVLKAIDLTVRTGDIIAIVGGSGSGKTVLLDHLVGLMQPDDGRVRAADHNEAADQDGQWPLVDLAKIDSDRLDHVRRHWSVVFQKNALFTGTVRENIALWLREHTSLSEEEIDARVRKSLEAVQLDVDDVMEKDRDALSGGMAKRVAIARAIAADPIVLFYDEPTTGLDPVVGGAIHELIWEMHHAEVGPRPTGPREEAPNLLERIAGKLPGVEGLLPEGALPGRDAGAADGRGGRADGSAGRGRGERWGRGGRRPGEDGEGGQPPRTTVIVTHDKELLRRLRPRVVMLAEGGVCFDGPYERFGQDDCEPAKEYLQEMPVLHARQ